MRLTEKKENGFYELKNGQEIYGEENGIRLVQIVGKYEDIEDELGIDLKVFAKMIIGTVVYSKNKNGDIIEQNFNIYIHSILHKCFCLNICGQKTPMYYFKDYGKTWALTREELK